MINISYDAGALRLRIEGHAGAAPKGQDIICSGVSSLYSTLELNLEELEREGRLKFVTCRNGNGDAELEVQPVGGMNWAITAVIYRTFCTGFRALAEQYPQNVAYSQEG